MPIPLNQRWHSILKTLDPANIGVQDAVKEIIIEKDFYL